MTDPIHGWSHQISQDEIQKLSLFNNIFKKKLGLPYCNKNTFLIGGKAGIFSTARQLALEFRDLLIEEGISVIEELPLGDKEYFFAYSVVKDGQETLLLPAQFYAPHDTLISEETNYWMLSLIGAEIDFLLQMCAVKTVFAPVYFNGFYIIELSAEYLVHELEKLVIYLDNDCEG